MMYVCRLLIICRFFWFLFRTGYYSSFRARFRSFASLFRFLWVVSPSSYISCSRFSPEHFVWGLYSSWAGFIRSCFWRRIASRSVRSF